ncbi:MAG TPA: hypothetical protein VHW44_04965 [Pseudonocardiaceae bacterium]|nr:hypothetical protein [Pseudonocardiaceae bacterium]
MTIAGCTSTPGQPIAASAPAQLIQPMTKVTEQPKQGYFSDPYPIHLAASDANAIPESLSGTTKQVLSCSGQPTADCFHPSQSQVTATIGPALAQQAAADGATLQDAFNYNIFQDDSGAWQMAVTYRVSNRQHPKATNWTAILHAHPTSTTPDAVPTSWAADSLLVGSFTDPSKADYDGKYFEDAGKLYLVYSDRLSDTPARDGIVAQLMMSPETPTATEPTVLLAPGDYSSELFFGLHQSDTFKLIETGNITEVDGKFVMAYSTGAYYEPDYKIGLAWSDTFLPAAGQPYRKITMTDSGGVWGKAGRSEVRYLMQSQEPGWPNYVGKTVLAPGVPAVIQDGQSWYLTFAGYLPSDAPTDPKTGHYVPSSRRPFFAPLSVRIPAGASVAGTSEADLANWITVGSNS